MNSKFLNYRKKYPDFIYKSFSYNIDDNLNIDFIYEIPGLEVFNHKIIIPGEYIKKSYDKDYLEYLIFNIGLIEAVNYLKSTCSRNVIIDAGFINDDGIRFFKKLYFKGLGELLYRNNIDISFDELFEFKCRCNEEKLPQNKYTGSGNLICVGGGKDSCVSLELLKNEKNNSCLIINPKDVNVECCRVAGYSDDQIIKVQRVLDNKIINLNNKGFLNGHIPFSSVVAFISYLVAYLNGKSNIILSNEASANESTVLGTDINHQYSKTYEFESDFSYYMSKINLNINYFSLLRGLSEFNIAKLFSHYKKYHKVFKSCNVGSKKNPWEWCCNCPKCLFIYIILSPFLDREELISIFGDDLYNRENLLDVFKEIIGYSDNKPFDCVGTYEEARYAISLVINKLDELPYLLKYYKDNYKLELDGSLIEKYNIENNIDKYYDDLVRKELDKYV